MPVHTHAGGNLIEYHRIMEEYRKTPIQFLADIGFLDDRALIGHGVFTTALIEALRHGDRDGDGLIQVSEFAAYVQDRVPELAAGGAARAAIAARGSAGGNQSARYGSRGEDFVFARRLP